MRTAFLGMTAALVLTCSPGLVAGEAGGAANGTMKACNTDLSVLAAEGGLRVVNRSMERLSEGGADGVRLNEQPGDGVAWLEGCAFSQGVIEFDVRGKDVQGRSFVGIAFHGANDSTFDAVYLRPFNFRAENPVRRDHAVQYVSHPAYPWFRLREDQPEVYENPVAPAPDPNDWVHVRIVVDSPKVSVFVGDGAEPDLEVDQLSERGQGWIGLWVGNQSGGDFANLRISERE